MAADWAQGKRRVWGLTDYLSVLAPLVVLKKKKKKKQKKIGMADGVCVLVLVMNLCGAG